MKSLLSQLCPLAWRSIGFAAVSAGSFFASLTAFIEAAKGVVTLTGGVIACVAGYYSIQAARSAIRLNEAKIRGTAKTTDQIK